MNIMVITEDSIKRNSIIDSLQGRPEISIFLAEEAPEGILMASSLFPDVILIDLDPSSASGMVTAKTIRNKGFAGKLVALLYGKVDNIDEMADSTVFDKVISSSHQEQIGKLLDSGEATKIKEENKPGGKPEYNDDDQVARILVVDDETPILNMYIEHFGEMNNRQLLITRSGHLASGLASNINLDLILMDYIMPNLDGLEALRLIQKSDSNIPVIMQTSYESINLGVEFIKSGGYDFVTKPIDFSLIDIKVAQALEQSSASLALKKKEREISAIEEKYQVLFEYASDAIFLIDPESEKILDVNQKASHISGYSRDELLSMTIDKLKAPEAKRRVLSNIAEVMDDDLVTFESTYMKKDGTIFDVEISCRVIEINEFYTIQSFVRDITKRKASQKDVHQTKKKLQAILDNVIEGIITISPQGVIDTYNKSAASLFGLNSINAKGLHINTLFSEKCLYRLKLLMKEAGEDLGKKTSLSDVVSLTGIRKSGRPFPMEVSISRVDPVDGGEMRFTLVIRDMEEKHRAKKELAKKQDQLVHSEKMAALGVMASGIAHEINQPLNHIALTAALVEKMSNDSQYSVDSLKGELKTIYRNTHRASQIITALKSFARKDSNDIEPIDLRNAIDIALSLFGSQLKSNGIDLHVSSPDEPIVAQVNENKLVQVIINLINNAQDAVIQNGDKGKKIKISLSLSGDDAILDVKDNGTGIPFDLTAAIFDPFFTTKPQGKGTGLGLSISHSIVNEFGGDLCVEKSDTSGTNMRIALPALHEAHI